MDYLQALSGLVITKVQALNPLILTGVATLLFWLVLSYRNSGAWKLRKFPTVGSSLPILSLICAINYRKNTLNLVAIGKQKWPGRIFKFPNPSAWHVVITDPTQIDDIRKAPEHILSQHKSTEQSLQTRFTFSPRVGPNPPIIRTQLTKETPGLVKDVYEEVVDCFNQYIPSNEWSSVLALETMTKIVARAANRAFVGPILCKNPEWIKVCIEFTKDITETAFLLNFTPSFLRPLVFYFVSGKVDQRNRGLKLLRPFIAARRAATKEERIEYFNDFLTWIIDELKGDDREDFPIMVQLLNVNFAAIHTTSMAITRALLDLASHPECLKLLREEVEEVIKRKGWTKAALDQMPKVDSFLKESQRLNPASVLSLSRCAVVDYTFSDGTFIPAGTIVGVSMHSVHLDPRAYEDPLRFDGLRFVKKKEHGGFDGHPGRKFDLVTTNADFLAFGQGRHACPGRYFASAELKLMLAYIVMTFDVKLDGVRPPDMCRLNGIQPDPAAKVYFRRRW